MAIEIKIEELIKRTEDGILYKHDLLEFCEVETLDYDEVEERLKTHKISVLDKSEVKEVDALDLIDPIIALESIEKIEEVTIDDFDTLPAHIKIDDPVRVYLKEIGRIQLLTAEQELMYATMVAEGNKAKDKINKALNEEVELENIAELQELVDKGKYANGKMVEANLRLVVSIAKKYINRGLAFLDLIQDGSIGLMKAVDKFEHEKGFKFSTYATWWIRQAISRSVADNSRTIRVPVHMVETIYRLSRVQKQLVQELSREPSAEEIAAKMEISLDKFYQIQKAALEPLSLEYPVGEEEGTKYGDFVADANTLDPLQHTSKIKLTEEIFEVLGVLTEREERVIKLRYGLIDKRQRTLEEVGKEFGVTRERIRQIETKALRKLKNPATRKNLKDFIN
ncbi:MAG: RNA polymerase sigma factor RpoD [Anaeroplasmataceae bacterium]